MVVAMGDRSKRSENGTFHDTYSMNVLTVINDKGYCDGTVDSVVLSGVGSPCGGWAMTEYDEWPELMTTEEVSVVLRTSPETVRRWVRKGDVPAIRLGGRWMLRKNDVKALLDPRPILAGGRIHPGKRAVDLLK